MKFADLMVTDVADTIYYFTEIPTDPKIMDVMFQQNDGLYFEHEFTKYWQPELKQLLVAAVKSCIESGLTVCQAEVIDLYYFHGKSENEIAVILNRHQTTISQHLIYARKKIKKACLSVINSYDQV